MLHTAESNFSNFVIEYLGEIETEFKNALACLSGAQMGSNHEKTGCRKSRDTLPLSLIEYVGGKNNLLFFLLSGHSVNICS